METTGSPSGPEGPAQPERGNARWAVLAGFSASLVGIGLARFAYTPLLPAIVDAHWFAASRAAYLGAANLAGYLAGALAGRALAARAGSAGTLRAMMLLASLAFFACARPVDFAWFFAWRFLAGFAGGALMVLAAPTVLPLVKPSRRGLAGGVIFMGVGVGVAASGTLVPLLLRQGLARTWCGLGALSLLLSLLAWRGWPPSHAAAHPTAAHHATHHEPPSGVLRALFAEYALNAAGWVPHMIFLVDFIARGLGRGLQVGAEYWVLFGLGASAGPILSGMLADRVGFLRALRMAFVLETFGVALPAVTASAPWLMVSSLLVGAFVTGTVPLVLGRVHELLEHHPARQGPAWRTATVCFALLQALAAYAMSWVFARSAGDYRLLFGLGSVALLLALAIDMTMGRRAPSVAKLA